MGFLKITPTITDWSDSKAIAFRITNNTNITTQLKLLFMKRVLKSLSLIKN